MRLAIEQPERKDDLINLVKLRFAHLKPEQTLHIYGIPNTSLKEFHSTPNKKKFNITNLPNKEHRLFDEEIKSSKEYEGDMSFNNQSMNSNTVDLDDENSEEIF